MARAKGSNVIGGQYQRNDEVEAKDIDRAIFQPFLE